MHKFLKIFLIVVGVISAILWYMLPSKDMPPTEAAQSGAMNFMFIITYLLLAIAVVASLFFALKGIFSNPAGLKRTLIGVGGFLLIVIISYVISSGTDVADQYMAMSDETTVKRIGAGIYTFFILTVVAIALMVIPGIKKLFSK